MEILPLASVVPLTGNNAGALLLLFTKAKVTGKPLTGVPVLSVTVALRMLFCPVDREDEVAVRTMLYPAVVVAVVLVMMTSPVEL